MANHKSALKRLRQSEKRRIRNASVKSAIKTQVKKVQASPSADDAGVELKKAVSLLDRAVTKGVLHRRNASRRIARLTVAVNASKATK